MPVDARLEGRAHGRAVRPVDGLGIGQLGEGLIQAGGAEGGIPFLRRRRSGGVALRQKRAQRWILLGPREDNDPVEVFLPCRHLLSLPLASVLSACVQATPLHGVGRLARIPAAARAAPTCSCTENQVVANAQSCQRLPGRTARKSCPDYTPEEASSRTPASSQRTMEAITTIAR